LRIQRALLEIHTGIIIENEESWSWYPSDIGNQSVEAGIQVIVVL
jgi:hypothetical protein